MRHMAAVRIQRVYRGHVAREAYREELPMFRQARQVLMYSLILFRFGDGKEKNISRYSLAILDAWNGFFKDVMLRRLI